MKLYWNVINACNLKCRYCYYNSGLKDRVIDHRLPDNYKKSLEDISKNFKEIVFTGGEALLHPQIFELIEFFKKRNIKITLLSNAVLLDEKIIKKLIDLKIDNLNISLDSLDENTNNYLRGESSEVIKAIENAVSLKPDIMDMEILQTVTRKNISSIKPMVDFCKENKINLWLNPVEVSCQSLADLSLEDLSEEELNELENSMKYWAKDNKTLLDYVDNCLSLINKEKPKKISCQMGTDSFVLDPNGDMKICFLKDEISLGNIYKESIKDILKSQKLKKLQEMA